MNKWKLYLIYLESILYRFEFHMHIKLSEPSVNITLKKKLIILSKNTFIKYHKPV